MAMKTYTITGECKWAKVWEPDERYGKHSLDIKLDNRGFKTFLSMGLSKTEAKEDEDGNSWVTFRRNPKQYIFVKGQDDKVLAGRPRVTGVDEGTLIGNGSIVTIVVSTYTYDNEHGKGTGSRLESVHVEKLVEFKKKADEAEDTVKSPF